MLVEWSKNMEIGVPFVDADHKVLINLLNQVDDCIAEQEESTVLSSVLESLIAYTEYHFAREEKLMELVGFSGFDEHKALHEKLFHKVRSIHHSFEADRESVSLEDVGSFLQSWLTQHILGEDVKYRDVCINNKDAAKEAGLVPFISSKDGNIPFNEWGLLRVLLVDDNPNFCKFISTILKAVGISNIEVTGSAENGLALLSRRPADVVLCDWIMDEMTGTEFAAKIEEMGLPSKVIMMTGYSIDELKSKSSETNISSYLEKPINAHDLLDTITRTAFND
ncbi:MAG: bacteriohemerythrin [Rhodospirillaceae bacterium]|nr:bacteriohemerythrin [Rhodospirillaceae bacterium]MCK5546193.1 bacteriohemerythrin [Rhodospirillaceae bacterium]